MQIELKPHQEEVLDRIRDGTILTGGVGTGKTVTALAYFWIKVLGGELNERGSLQRSMDLYIFTTAKKRDSLDWQKWAMRFGLSTDPDISPRGIQVTVDSYNNIGKYKDISNAFIILDEQKMVGSGKWTKTFIHLSKSNRWIMLSATPGDRWEDYIPVFVANGFYKNRTAFNREHCVYSYYGSYPKLERYMAVNKLVRLRSSILVDMPYERHTTRHIHTVPVSYERETFQKVVKDRWHVYEDRPLNDIGEMYIVMRKVANSDPSRVEAVRDLLEKHPRLIVFYNFDYELEILRGLFQERVSSVGDTNVSQTALPNSRPRLAEWNGHKHEDIPESDSWVYLVQYTAGAEAWDCTRTDAMCFYSLNYSYRIFEQCQGRIDRLNTPYADLHYYVLKSKSYIDVAIAKALNQKQDFQELKN